MSDLFVHRANNNNNNNKILLRPKRIYHRVAYLINKVLRVPFEMTILWCIFCYRVYIFLSVSSLIFKLFSTIKATGFICSICYLTFISLYVSVNSNWIHPPRQPLGISSKNLPEGSRFDF